MRPYVQKRTVRGGTKRRRRASASNATTRHIRQSKQIKKKNVTKKETGTSTRGEVGSKEVSLYATPISSHIPSQQNSATTTTTGSGLVKQTKGGMCVWCTNDIQILRIILSRLIIRLWERRHANLTTLRKWQCYCAPIWYPNEKNASGQQKGVFVCNAHLLRSSTFPRHGFVFTGLRGFVVHGCS